MYLVTSALMQLKLDVPTRIFAYSYKDSYRQKEKSKRWHRMADGEAEVVGESESGKSATVGTASGRYSLVSTAFPPRDLQELLRV